MTDCIFYKTSEDRGIDMFDMFVGILLTTALLTLGAILFVFVCAMIGWMVYSTQNGGDDD